MMFAALYNRVAYWKKEFLPGGEAELLAFWNNFDSRPAMQDGVIRSKPNYKKACIPIAIHSDSVPCVGLGKVWAKLMQVFFLAWCLMPRRVQSNTLHAVVCL